MTAMSKKLPEYEMHVGSPSDWEPGVYRHGHLFILVGYHKEWVILNKPGFSVGRVDGPVGLAWLKVAECPTDIIDPSLIVTEDDADE